MHRDPLLVQREMKQPPGYKTSLALIWLDLGLEQVAALEDDFARWQMHESLCAVCGIRPGMLQYLPACPCEARQLCLCARCQRYGLHLLPAPSAHDHNPVAVCTLAAT